MSENTDNSNRPKPIGHEELSNKWVGAGHLKAGDTLKKADGTLGTVVYVNTLAETRKMYNLEVQSAHTFFVGQNGWLTHNCSNWLGIKDHLTKADLRNPGHLSGGHTRAALDETGLPYTVSKRGNLEVATVRLPNGKIQEKTLLPDSFDFDRLEKVVQSKNPKGNWKFSLGGYEFIAKPSPFPGAPPQILPIGRR